MYDDDYQFVNDSQHNNEPNHMIDEPEQEQAYTEYSDEYDTANTNEQLSPNDQQQLQCKHCPYQINDAGKLLLHMATHYTAKPYMCPVCSHKATLKIDIQKHLHVVHSDYTSEIIHLNNIEGAKTANNNQNQIRASNILASVLLNGNKDLNKRPSSSLSSLSSSSFNSNIKQDQLNYQNILPAAGNSRNKGIDYNKLNSGDPEVTHSYLANLKFLARRRSQHALRDKKFKCPLCARTSKWQWDIRKHMRTVHRGQEGGAVIILKEKDLVKSEQMDNEPVEDVNDEQQPTLKMNTQQNSLVGGTDHTGNKKFKCTSCPYRSNWKADLFRHLRKRHYVEAPDLDNVIILDENFAANSLAEYEQHHGVHIRKRSRTELDPQGKKNTLFFYYSPGM